MEKKYLGGVERLKQPYDKTLVFAFWNENAKDFEMSSGYILEFYDIERLLITSVLLDSDHVYRELQSMGYKKSYIKVILSML